MKSLFALILSALLVAPAMAQEASGEEAAGPEPLVKLRKGKASAVDPESGERIEVPYQVYDGPSSFKIIVPLVIEDESELPPEQMEQLPEQH